MASPSQVAAEAAAGRDHGFHPLRIGRVVTETADASSFVLDVPAELRTRSPTRPASSAPSG